MAKVVANKASPETEEKIASIRRELMIEEKEGFEYSCLGVDAIQHKFSELGYSDEEIPKASVIKRVVRESGLRVQKKKRYKRVHSKKRYKKITPTQINEFYCIDFKGPLYLKGDGRPIYGFCVKDTVSGKVHVEITRTKSTDFVLTYFTQLFKKHAIPHYLQMDNERSFTGDFHHPKTIGRFLKFLLHARVEPIFIAPRKPWMNGSAEEFVKLFSKNFWARKQFKSEADVRLEVKKFETNHNRLQQWKLRDKALKMIPARTLDKDYKFNPQTKITTGRIHLIREVKNNGKINVLNEEINVDKGYANERIWTTIDVAQDLLTVHHKAKDDKKFRQIKKMSYKIANL